MYYCTSCLCIIIKCKRFVFLENVPKKLSQETTHERLVIAILSKIFFYRTNRKIENHCT
jgi:hypothetical protein